MNLLWAFNFIDTTGRCSMGLENYHVCFFVNYLCCTRFTNELSQPGVELSPNRFVCDITVRDAKRANLIKETYMHTTA